MKLNKLNFISNISRRPLRRSGGSRKSRSAVAAALLAVITSVPHLAAQSGTGQNVPEAPVKISASIDTTTLTMGERTTLHVELLKNGHKGTVLAPVSEPSENKPAMLGGVEIRKVDIDSTDLGNNRIQVKYDILLQPFEPKDVVLPAFKYALDRDTFTSNVIALKVLEPEIPKEMRDSLYINPLRPPMSLKSAWYDWIPDWITEYWWIWLLALVIAGLGVCIFVLYKRNGAALFGKIRVVSPYEVANARLDKLKRRRLHEQGHDKEFFTELTDILRQYLGGRFRIYALEMTTPQILEAMSQNSETAQFIPKIKEMLDIADFVKFAKQNSTVDENVRSFNTVKSFVKETRPIEASAKTTQPAKIDREPPLPPAQPDAKKTE